MGADLKIFSTMGSCVLPRIHAVIATNFYLLNATEAAAASALRERPPQNG